MSKECSIEYNEDIRTGLEYYEGKEYSTEDHDCMEYFSEGYEGIYCSVEDHGVRLSEQTIMAIKNDVGVNDGHDKR